MEEKLEKLIEKLKAKKEIQKEKERLKKKKETLKKNRIAYRKRKKLSEKKLREEKKALEKAEKLENKEKKELFLIILTSRKYRIETLKTFFTYTNAIKYFNDLIEQNKSVVFPVRFILNNRITRKIMDADYEILLVRKKHENENKISELRNEFGKYVENEIVDSEKLKILEKSVFYKEETFWVFGYNPKTERKTFNFIYDKFFLSEKNKEGCFKRIVVLLNKVIIQYDNDIELVLCKNKEDAIRLYNVLSEMTSKDKIKNVFFNGIVSGVTRKYITDLIMQKTGWNKTKVNRGTTQT